MKVTRLALACLALVAAINVWLYCSSTSVLSWLAMFLLGFIAGFPIDYTRRLYHMLFDIRPMPQVWGTVALADPQDGYPEKEDWRILGTVLEEVE